MESTNKCKSWAKKFKSLTKKLWQQVIERKVQVIDQKI